LSATYATTQRHFDRSLGGLLSALILLAGVPGSALGGHLANRSRDLQAIIVGSLMACTLGLILIPYVSASALWVLGIGIGLFLVFGFAAWSSVPNLSAPEIALTPAWRPGCAPERRLDA